MLTLKDYQHRALDDLRDYFVECSRTGDADTSFYKLTERTLGQRVPYVPVPSLPGLPYVCLRMPTGGGKTLVACHAVGIAARELLHADAPLVLWLVPSKEILEQTLKALRNREHPYRQAVEADAASVNVLDVEEALYVTPAQLNSGTTIVVSTIQSFRVEDTVGRRVYRDNGSLMDHFTGVPPEVLSEMECGEEGNLLHSLANVLRLRRPIVIVDEAHNARTPLSFDTLARFAPSCIIEFTATPDRGKNASNILHTASAAELKAEAMIKMPIRLETRPDWHDVLADAVACRNALEEEAKAERRATGEYIRPVMLLQAESRLKDQERTTADVLKECLLSDHRTPEEQIAIATGDQKELADVDVLSPGCPVRYVITVQALREGWDCPFAYVLCSVAEVRSTVCVEQILGRIMRLPRAMSKKQDALNRAYAFSASRSFAEAASALTDALIQNGFQRQEARDLIVEASLAQTQLQLPGGTFLGAVTVPVPESPNMAQLPDDVRIKTVFNEEAGTLTFQGVMTAQERDTLKECFTLPEAKQSMDRAYRVSQGLPEQDHGTPSERGVLFSIPVLAVRQGTLPEPFEDSHFLDHPWQLSQCDAELSPAEYAGPLRSAEQGEIYATDNGRIRYRFISAVQERMGLFALGDRWAVAALVHWLDSGIRHPDIDASETGVFLTSSIHYLLGERGMSLSDLVRDKYRLRDALATKIAEHRREARQRVRQTFLDPASATPFVVTPEVCFTYEQDPRQYACGRVYRGPYKFQKHYYPEVGDLAAEGEEFECARHIDQMNEVDFWVKNLERRGARSFSFQTLTDRFYPDFVAKLHDGRWLVVESKGADRWSNDDSREKRDLGELWMERSGGTCLFIMPKGPDLAAVDALVARGTAADGRGRP